MEISNINLQEVYSKLEEILKCPICLEQLEPPVKQCQRGHGVCGRCKKNLNECPLCRTEFNEFKATALTQIVEVVPRTCKFRSAGCLDVSLAKDKHSNYCEFRPIGCILCGALTSARTLTEHFKHVHNKTHSKESLSGPLIGLNLLESATRIGLFSLFGHLFWRKMSTDIEKQLFVVTFALVPLGKPTKNYYAKIKLKKGNLEYSSASLIRVRQDCNSEPAIPNFIAPLHDIRETFCKTNDILAFECLNIEEHSN